MKGTRLAQERQPVKISTFSSAPSDWDWNNKGVKGWLTSGIYLRLEPKEFQQSTSGRFGHVLCPG